MIDLHTHSTASDGRCTPAELVALAGRAGVDVLALTDHDTVSACPVTAAACAAASIAFVPGIEITAIRVGIDVHVLGYFIDIESGALRRFLDVQRAQRIERVREIIARLAQLGMPLDADEIVRPATLDRSRSAGRPWIARALVTAGFVASTAEAFERWLGSGRAAYVPRRAAPPEDVFARIHQAGGLASIAHPGLLGHDEWLAGFVASGLDAIEAYHPDHDQEATLRYLALADRLSVPVSGGSDFHGDAVHFVGAPGAVSLPREAFDGLLARRRSKEPVEGHA